MTTSVVPKHWCDRLEDVDACDDAVAWARTQPSPEAAWQNCDRGDWMLWIIGRVAGGKIDSPKRRQLVLAACDCAELSPLVLESEYPNDGRPRNAIETVRRYALGDGSATLSAVHAAVEAAETAAEAAMAAEAAAWATETVGRAAWAAEAAMAAEAAAWATETVGRAAWVAEAAMAAEAAAWAAAWAANDRFVALRQCADIVRKHYPHPPEFP